jgi:hypothetical protein
MDKQCRDQLLTAIADGLTLEASGMMAHYTLIHSDIEEEIPVLFTFTQGRMFHLTIDGATLILTPRSRLDEAKGPSFKKEESLKDHPEGRFDLANHNMFSHIIKYIKGIPHHE